MKFERRSRRPGQSAAPTTSSPDACQSNDLHSQLRRRRNASRRLIPLDCGCRDPWPCRCTEPPLSQHQVNSWAKAARHILDTGHTPLLPLEVRRALYRRGGADWALTELHTACGEAVA